MHENITTEEKEIRSQLQKLSKSVNTTHDLLVNELSPRLNDLLCETSECSKELPDVDYKSNLGKWLAEMSSISYNNNLLIVDIIARLEI